MYDASCCFLAELELCFFTCEWFNSYRCKVWLRELSCCWCCCCCCWCCCYLFVYVVCLLVYLFFFYKRMHFYYAFTWKKRKDEHMSPPLHQPSSTIPQNPQVFFFYPLHTQDKRKYIEWKKRKKRLKKNTRKKNNKTLETTRNTQDNICWYDATAESNIYIFYGSCPICWHIFL